MQPSCDLVVDKDSHLPPPPNVAITDMGAAPGATAGVGVVPPIRDSGLAEQLEGAR